MPKAFDQGLWAEEYAARFLDRQGFKTLVRRYATPDGEIDIIARQSNLLLAVEVKYRKRLNQGISSVTPTQCRRIENAMLHFLSEMHSRQKGVLDGSTNGRLDLGIYDLRFDVIIVSANKEIHHIPHAWSPER